MKPSTPSKKQKNGCQNSELISSINPIYLFLMRTKAAVKMTSNCIVSFCGTAPAMHQNSFQATVVKTLTVVHRHLLQVGLKLNVYFNLK